MFASVQLRLKKILQKLNEAIRLINQIMIFEIQNISLIQTNPNSNMY